MDKIKKIQDLMISYNIDALIIPTSDYHNSEYISDYFKTRQYLSGFTGSAATLLILRSSAYLWTDGRYFIQAEKQLENTGITLMKMGQPNVDTIEQFLDKNLNENQILAFDGRVMSTRFVNHLKNNINKKINIISDKDLVSEIWTDRPPLPFSLLYLLDEEYCGEAYVNKLAKIRSKMESMNAELYVISALEDQAWLYNLRANDVLHTPVFLAFTVITTDEVYLFIENKKIKPSINRYLDKKNVIIKEYDEIYEFLKQFKNKEVILDDSKTNYQIYSSLINNNINFITDITLYLKCIKNDIEVNNTKYAHILDGVSVTKLMYYLKNSFENNLEISELSISNKLEELRKENKGFIDLSFNTICAFNDHGAMMHYSATEESNYKIDKPGFLLIDSGGQYFEGTTDITRTFALGKITKEMKLHFTTVLKSMIRLSKATFLKGCNGQNLDILARGPIWDLLLDYKCGTGHGVGHILSVHEAPNGFRWQIVKERNDSHKFEPNMITTNEPGIYLEGKYGIRIENELLCVEKGESEFGSFLGFETLTFAPIDLDAIDKNILNKEEKEWLNQYHAQVYEKLSEYLNDEEKEWLLNYTRAI